MTNAIKRVTYTNKYKENKFSTKQFYFKMLQRLKRSSFIKYTQSLKVQQNLKENHLKIQVLRIELKEVNEYAE